jgi:hypothetical protein
MGGLGPHPGVLWRTRTAPGRAMGQTRPRLAKPPKQRETAT